MADYGTVAISSIMWMVVGLLTFIVVPVGLTILWIIKKKEKATTVLIGAATFIVFVFILEKPIQNVLLFPTAMGLPDHAVSMFFGAHPVVLAFLAGLFPGVFEETGRLIAYKTVLKKRSNKETAISYGIGHGGIEVVGLLGLTYVNYIIYAVMMNTGFFQVVVDQVAAQAPDQIGQIEQIVTLLTTFSGSDVMLAVIERIFAVMFHVGASILVFYACRDKGKFWLYPLAIVLHTVMDFVMALALFKVIRISEWELELIVGIVGIAILGGSYLLLYKKDR